MEKRLFQHQIEIILQQITEIKQKLPKANVYYDTERDNIAITYPLPNDFYRASIIVKPLTNK